MIKFFGADDPEPADLILSFTETEYKDNFEVMDRLALTDRLEAVGKNYSINIGLQIMIFSVFMSVIAYFINWIMGYPTDPEAVLVSCLGLPLLVTLGVFMGIRWVLRAYRDALQVVLYE